MFNIRYLLVGEFGGLGRGDAVVATEFVLGFLEQGIQGILKVGAVALWPAALRQLLHAHRA